MEENTIIYHEATLLSGNKVAYVPQTEDQLQRCIVYTPDGVIIRGALGLAAKAMWDKYTSDKTSVQRYGFAELLQKLTIWSELEKQFPGEIPSREICLTLISDMDIEREYAGNACGDRHKFYAVTTLSNNQYADRYTYVEGRFELFLIFFHILNAGKLALVKRIWENGKNGSQAPKTYIKNLISFLNK